MTNWMYLVLALAMLAPKPGGGTSAQEPEAFAPFEQPAYRLTNSIDFSPDGEAMYFALLHRAALSHRGLPYDGAPETAMYSSRRTEEGWGEPELLPMSGIYGDYEPSLSPDGTLMVFNSKRPYGDGRTPESNDLWMVERGEDGWGEPARIEALTSFEQEESYGTLTSDRTLVYLRGVTGPGDEVGYDLYWSRFVDGVFAEPERHPVSTDRWGEGDAWVAPDGSYLLFTRWDNSVGWGTTVDLFISFEQEKGWTEPVALEELNTLGADYSPAVSPDGKWLYYRANSHFKRIELAPILSRYRPE